MGKLLLQRCAGCGLICKQLKLKASSILFSVSWDSWVRVHKEKTALMAFCIFFFEKPLKIHCSLCKKTTVRALIALAGHSNIENPIEMSGLER